MYKMTPGEYPKYDVQKTTKDKFVGNGWDIVKNDNQYILSYISGSLQGKEKQHKVSKEDFELAKVGKIDLDGLCTKYNIY